MAGTRHHAFFFFGSSHTITSGNSGTHSAKITQLAARKRVNPEAIAYINRLSDHLFVLARRLNGNGSSDVLWVPGGTRQSR